MAQAFLTHRKQQIYEFIVKFKNTHDGNSPSIAEIGRHCEVNSTSTVRFYLQGMERLGLIKLSSNGEARMIEVVGGTWTPPALPVVLNEADAHKLLEVVKV